MTAPNSPVSQQIYAVRHGNKPARGVTYRRNPAGTGRAFALIATSTMTACTRPTILTSSWWPTAAACHR
jgi:hypothetical protein